MSKWARICAGICFTAVLLSATLPVANAGRRRSCACETCAPQSCAPQTVMVPQFFTENRTVTCTEYRTEQRECKSMVCRPVWEEQDQVYTVMVPHQEDRTGTCTVYENMPRIMCKSSIACKFPTREQRKATAI